MSKSSNSLKKKRRHRSKHSVCDDEDCKPKSPPDYIVIEKDSTSDSEGGNADKRKRRKSSSRRKSNDLSFSQDEKKEDFVDRSTEELDRRRDAPQKRSNNTDDFGRLRDSSRGHEDRRERGRYGDNNPYYRDYPYYDYNSWNQARDYFTSYRCPYPRDGEFLSESTPYDYQHHSHHPSYENQNTQGRFNYNNAHRNFGDGRNDNFNHPRTHNNGPPHSWGRRRPYVHRPPHRRNGPFHEIVSRHRPSYMGSRGRGRPHWNRYQDERRRPRTHTSSFSTHTQSKNDTSHATKDKESIPKKESETKS